MVKTITLLTSILYFVAIETCAAFQDNEIPTNYNFGFEEIDASSLLPKEWEIWGSETAYNTSIDSMDVSQGSYALQLNSNDEEVETGTSFTALMYKIPGGYSGQEIKLEGDIKTQSIEDGFAGLVLRIDKNNRAAAFDNMESQDLHGSNDWERYNITHSFPQDADYIYVGAILSGNGKAWFDNFTLTIDGEAIENLMPVEKKPFKAELDKEFDQGSKFSIKSPTKQETENLYQLAKTWGFLKYHHQDIAKGDYNWDYELFRILPSIKNENFELSLQQWKASFGEISKDSLEGHYYVDFAPNPEFNNEKAYSKMDWNDDGLRLLALFRYWSMVEYFFPYKHLTDKDWDDVLLEYIPKILEANNELSYKLEVLKLIGEVNDTHATLMYQDSTLNSFFGNNIVPIKVAFVENKPIITELYEDYPVDTALHVGLEITAINQRPIDDHLIDIRPYYPASNSAAQLRDISDNLLRTSDSVLSVTFKFNDKEFSEELLTTDFNGFPPSTTDSSNPLNETDNREIAYLNLETLRAVDIPEIMEKYSTKKGIIIDCRAYPTDFLVFELTKHLVPEATEFVKFALASLHTPGAFTLTDPLTLGEDNPDYYKGKVAILVNETTQSSAEYHAMAFQVAPKAKVFGSQTAGADGNVSYIVLPGNIHTMFTGIGVYYPDGTETQRIGIVPDTEVNPTVRGIIAGEDEVLEAALRYLKSD